MISIKLSKLGYGTVQQIEKMPIDVVFDILEYEKFVNEYEFAFYELNKNK